MSEPALKGKVTNVDDTAQGSNGIGSEDGIAAAARILHNGAGNHDDILSRVGQLLDDEVDHLSEAGILVLEELRDAEEKGGGFIGWELLPSIEEKSNLGEEDSTSSRLNGAFVEYACCNVGLAFVLSGSRKGHRQIGSR